ncbi:putative gamma-tubulin complex component protein [Septoria linicola]|nr:putative gamma-tubulin complex component protein [Septoria linicola]
MAHAARLDKLAEGLVIAITGRRSDDPAFRALKGQATKGLRDKSHARTNQFAVKARLDGVVEKLAVLNRDDLSDALQERIEELPSASQWSPEVLSLLLELSDRPATRTLLSHVRVDDSTEDIGPQLKWEDIIAEEPVEETGLWDDIDRGYHSSADDISDVDEDSEPTTSTTATSVGDDPSATARLHLTQPDESTISAIREAQAGQRQDENEVEGDSTSELYLVREMLMMLHGLPTKLFPINPSTRRISISQPIKLATASNTSISDLVAGSVKTAAALNYLRGWTRSSQALIYLRAVQAAIQKLMGSFATQLSSVEQRFVGHSGSSVVSIVSVLTDVRSLAAPLIQLSSMVQVAALSTGKGQQLVMLDSLYDAACIVHMSGARPSSDAIMTVFLAGLQAYLRPVAAWAVSGEHSTFGHDIPLVQAVNADCPAGQIWSSQFVRSTKADGSPFVPRCLADHADKLFALGKSRAFLKRLQPKMADTVSTVSVDMNLPDFEPMLDLMALDGLHSFPQLLNDRLNDWISAIGEDCTPLLLASLQSEHGLSSTMAALPKVFFSADGIAFQDFADAVAKRVVVKGSGLAWNDQFMLAELARGTIGICEGVDSDCIQVSTPPGSVGSTTTSTTRALNTFSLEYNFSWPLQNITACAASATHAQVFAFLLQVHYAGNLLTRSFFYLRAAEQRLAPIVPLRQKLLCFTHVLHYFIVTTADSIHLEMLEAMNRAVDIDAMTGIWRNYDRRLQMSLLLSPKLEPVRDAITGILELSELLAKSTREDSIKALQDQFDRGLTFLIAGVRGLGRAGGEAALETLAERLECSIQ